MREIYEKRQWIMHMSGAASAMASGGMPNFDCVIETKHDVMVDWKS